MKLRRKVWVAALAMALGMGGCTASNEVIHGWGTTQTWTLAADPRVPAATGNVSVLAGKDGNQSVDVRVQRLAPPDRVFQGASTYVVWLIPPDGQPENIGVLPVDKDQRARLVTKTPFKDFDLEVTAEATPVPPQPNIHTRVMNVSIRIPT